MAMTFTHSWPGRLMVIAHLVCSSLIIAWPSSDVSTADSRGRPPTYCDTKWGITLSVESDGRHVVATNRRHEVLWRADPFTAAGLAPYRTVFPIIVYIGPLEGVAGASSGERAAVIRFDSTQFGKIDLDSGQFTFLGQD
jgi:hypothetical protein